MKRKILIIVGIVILIVGVMAALPFIYKDKLLAKVKTTINSQVNAKVDFTAFNLSVFAEFPKVKMEIQGLTIIGMIRFCRQALFQPISR